MIARGWRRLSIAVRCWWLTFLVGRLIKIASKGCEKRVFSKIDRT